jgi:hypothetical protein
MDRDILRITSEGSNILFHPIKRHTLVSESRILTRQCCRLGETKDAQSVIEADMYHWKAVVDGLNDQATRLRRELVFCANDIASAYIPVREVNGASGYCLNAPCMKTMTGSLSSLLVPLGRLTLRLKQSSE